jgi:plastocyanin
VRRWPAPVLLGALFLSLVLAGCGGGASGGGAGGASPVATSTVDLPASYRFAPADIRVVAGTTVTWTNHDNFSHSVQFLDGGLPSEPRMMKPGESTTFTFQVAGLFHYQCSFHPQNMKGSVLVTSP